MSEKKQKIAILTDWFDPAWKAGGPVRSMINLIEHMHADYEFYVVCGDTDYGDQTPLEGIRTDEWQDWHGKAKVFYFSRNNLSRRKIFGILDEIDAEVVYVQGLFSLYFNIHPLIWWQQAQRGNLIIAPRGMLHRSALNIKKWKKKTYLTLARLMGWFNNALWHSTNAEETEEIRHEMGNEVKITEASNFPVFVSPGPKQSALQGSTLRLLCVSRISDEKNPLLLAEALKLVNSHAELTFAGDYRDERYFRQFDNLVKSLPGHIKVNYLGAVPPESLPLLYQTHDLFVFPSRGENFGHAIAEALMHGLPVLIGGNTPWSGVAEAGAGFVSAETPGNFARFIDHFSELSAEEKAEMGIQAIQFVNTKLKSEEIAGDYKKLFYVERLNEEESDEYK